jgi:hypothetical protein
MKITDYDFYFDVTGYYQGIIARDKEFKLFTMNKELSTSPAFLSVSLIKI